MEPPTTPYNRFLEDAPVIVKTLETAHNCLVDENLVFERLESFSKRHPDCQDDCLVKRVISSFLHEYGLTPSDSPDIQIHDIVEPKVPSEPSTSSSVPAGTAASCSKAEAIIETWTSSPGLCQAFSKPLVSYPFSPEEDKEETASGSSHATIGSPVLKKRESFSLDPSEVFVSEKNLISSPQSPKKTHSPASRDEGPLLYSSIPSIPSIKSERAIIASESKAAAYAATLSEMFPQADPQYLRDKAEKIRGDNELRTLIDFMLSTNDYPRVCRGFKPNSNVSAAAGSAVRRATENEVEVLGGNLQGLVINIVNTSTATCSCPAAKPSSTCAQKSRHTCKTCGKVYSRMNKLWNHEEQEHNAVIPQREARKEKQAAKFKR